MDSLPVTSTLTRQQLLTYVATQLNHFFPDGNDIAESDLSGSIDRALERLATALRAIRIYNPQRLEIPAFNHLYTDHYTMFLYLLSNELGEKGASHPATKLYALNKALHGVEVFYEVKLPEIFFLCHPVGAVLGRATYGNYFAAYQGVTLGEIDGVYPTLGEGVTLFAGATVIGGGDIGNNVNIAANAAIVSKDIPDNKTVVGQGKEMRILDAGRNYRDKLFYTGDH